MTASADHEQYNALKLLTSTIANCERMLPKFEGGSSQHSLLINRIKALVIARAIMQNQGQAVQATYTRFHNIITGMTTALNSVEKELIGRKIN